MFPLSRLDSATCSIKRNKILFLFWNGFIETYLLDFLKFALRASILTPVDVCWALVLEAHAEVMATHVGRKQPDLSVPGAFHLPPPSLASKIASLVMGSSRQVLKRLWAHFIGCRNATDGGGSQQTHKVAREDSHQLMAQDTAGCENGLYKVKRKKNLSFSRNHPEMSAWRIPCPWIGERVVMVMTGEPRLGSTAHPLSCGAGGLLLLDPDVQSRSGTRLMTFTFFIWKMGMSLQEP